MVLRNRKVLTIVYHFVTIMKIKINNTDFTVFEYDDHRTILERYAVTKLGALPHYFAIDNKDVMIVEGAKITVSDVRDVIKKVSSEQFTDKAFVENLITKYTGLKKYEIGILWVRDNYKFTGNKSTNPIDVTNLKILDRNIFSSSIRAESAVADYIAEVTPRIDTIKKKIVDEDKIFNVLAKKVAVKTDEITIEEITNQTILKLANDEALIDVFDAMDVSVDIPFIMLMYQRKRYYKIYKHVIPLDSWINLVPSLGDADGIYFKILNYNRTIRQISLDNLYSDALWNAQNRIELNFRIRKDVTEADMSKKLFKSLGDRLQYKIVSTQQTAIKSVFTIPEFIFNRAVFIDLVYSNDNFKYFLFFNETQKTTMLKPRFYAYYAPHQRGMIASSLTLTITPTASSPDDQSAIVRISHARNFQQAHACRLIIAKLLTIYNAEYNKIIGIYANLLPNFKTLADVFQKKGKKKEDKKTGPRAIALRKYRADLFGSRYPDQCQKEKQPYLISTEDDAKKLATDFGDPHKIMFFEGAWYACDPRELNDKNYNHLFPGLKKNTSKLDKKYKEDHDLLPCCYKKDQYEKASSLLRKYYKTQEAQRGNDKNKEKDKEGGMGYIVGPNKRLQPGRFGELPFNWEKILTFLDIKKVTKGRQQIYPLLRQGVLQSPDSFFHCMERATNKKYVSAIATEKRNIVLTARKKMSTAKNFNYSKQELHDIDDDNIKRILNDENEYIDARKFIGIAQQYYQCNVYLYVVDENNPNGNIVIPDHSQAYLPRVVDTTTKPSVLIIMYETNTDSYPYQCDIVTLLDVAEGKVTGMHLTFKYDAISSMASKLFYSSNEIFVVSSTAGYELYTPV